MSCVFSGFDKLCHRGKAASNSQTSGPSIPEPAEGGEGAEGAEGKSRLDTGEQMRRSEGHRGK